MAGLPYSRIAAGCCCFQTFKDLRIS